MTLTLRQLYEIVATMNTLREPLLRPLTPILTLTRALVLTQTR